MTPVRSDEHLSCRSKVPIVVRRQDFFQNML